LSLQKQPIILKSTFALRIQRTLKSILLAELIFVDYVGQLNRKFKCRRI